MSTSRPNQSMMHGIQCLQYLAAAGRPVGSREMARFLGVEHTRVHRAIGTLELLGLAEKTPDRKYCTGPAVHVLAAQSLRGSSLLACALPHLRKLRAGGHTVALGVLWRDHVCYLVHARPGDSMEEAIGRHELWPAERSSLGVALLRQPGGRARAAGGARLRYPDGTVSYGVPIGSPPIAGLAASRRGLKGREARDLVSRLRRAAAEIAAAMGRDRGGKARYAEGARRSPGRGEVQP